MPLQPGTTLGPYEILSPIGAGGMGEVYKARDTKLDRDVALKVLPKAFTSDPDRLARFEREAVGARVAIVPEHRKESLCELSSVTRFSSLCVVR